MNEHRLFTTSKYTLGLTAEAVDRFQYYPAFYIKVGRLKLEEYRQKVEDGQMKPDNALIASVQQEIEAAEAVNQAFEELAGALQIIFSWHFKKLAEVKRQARIVGGYQRIEDSPDLYRDTVLTMDMLKAENPYFSREKFIAYINSAGEAL